LLSVMSRVVPIPMVARVTPSTGSKLTCPLIDSQRMAPFGRTTRYSAATGRFTSGSSDAVIASTRPPRSSGWTRATISSAVTRPPSRP
jgi:hypothetical protein